MVIRIGNGRKSYAGYETFFTKYSFRLITGVSAKRERNGMHSNQIQSSPCNKNCIIDPMTHFCKGCFRTIEEIIQWAHCSTEIKSRILKEVETRKSYYLKENKLYPQ